ncbi:MAG: hypothetical protein RLZZ502_1589, partial [Pseudomonadota bacterium]
FKQEVDDLRLAVQNMERRLQKMRGV